MPKEPRASHSHYKATTTAAARQLFLYGDGSGKRILTPKCLAERAGCAESTVRKYLPQWEKEAEEIALAASPAGLSIQLNREKIQQNENDLEFLRGQVEEVKFELESLADITERLFKLVERFSDDEDMRSEALSLFNSWVQSCGKKATLRASFVTLKRLWDEKCAIDGLRDVALSREKELAKGRVKLQLKGEAHEGQDAPRIVAGGVFARPRPEITSAAIEMD